MLYLINDISYNYSEGIITKNGKEVILTNKQKELLNFFIDNPETILSKNTLMEKVWGRIITENSVDQVISKLRLYLEDNPSEPKYLATQFGKGLVFTVVPQLVEDSKAQSINNKKKKKNKFKYSIPLLIIGLSLLIIMTVIRSNYSISKSQEKNTSTNQITTNHLNVKKMLILPTTFSGEEINPIKKIGMTEILKSTFIKSPNEGRIIFDESIVTTKQTIEKHWRLDKNLLVIQAKVIKTGNSFQSIIELSNGIKTLNKTQLSSSNLNDLLNKQIKYIAKLSGDKDEKKGIFEQSPSELLILALGYKKNGELDKAKQLLQQVLQEKGDYAQARLSLAEILFSQKQYDKSLSQLQTLKITPAYQSLGTEIELGIAEIYIKKNQFTKAIDALEKFLINNLDSSEIKKAKIRLMIAQAYLGNNDTNNSLKNYQNAITSIDENLNPLLFAKSYWGQARTLLLSSIKDNVYQLFEKSYNYAILAGDIQQQIIALNEMASISFAKYDWDRAVSDQKKSIELMEFVKDKSSVARGYGTLAGILNQRGNFSDAKKVVNKLGKIAKELDSDFLTLQYLHFDTVIAINTYKWKLVRNQIDLQLKLAIKSKNLGMQLDNAFLEFEYRLAKNDTKDFYQEWQQRNKLIKQHGFDRYQIYMDYYLARYYKTVNEDNKAIELFNLVTEKAKVSNDYKIIVDVQNQLAEIYFKTDPKKSLNILNNIEQYNPHPNPYLDLKAKALHLLGNNIEALNVLNQAKKVYNESWTTENQALYDEISDIIQNKK